MLLKISLGLAILVGLATLYVAHFQVGERITTLTSNVATLESDLNTSRQNEQQAKNDVKKLSGQLETTTKAYSQATNDLTVAITRAEEQRQRADANAAQLVEVTKQRNTAQEELGKWTVFGMTIDQIRNQLGTLRKVERERDVFGSENKMLTQEVGRLERELARYTRPDYKVQLPPGTKGTVVAVDPKYDFVVIDIGKDKGVLEGAEMLVNREGKLIGKVKITSVGPNRSIANVMPEWKQGDVEENDQVIF